MGEHLACNNRTCIVCEVLPPFGRGSMGAYYAQFLLGIEAGIFCPSMPFRPIFVTILAYGSSVWLRLFNTTRTSHRPKVGKDFLSFRSGNQRNTWPPTILPAPSYSIHDVEGQTLYLPCSRTRASGKVNPSPSKTTRASGDNISSLLVRESAIIRIKAFRFYQILV
jgi:hypothetical protein